MDATFYIPDYDDVEEIETYDPEDEMPYTERERLDMELDDLIDAGAFEPEREILF